MGMDNLVSSHSDDAKERRYKRLESARKEIDRDPAGVKKAQTDSINDSKKLADKRKAKSSTPAPKREAKSSPVDSAPTSSSFDTKAAGKGAAETMAGGGSAMDTVSSGLMMSGNPYAMAAGAALKVVGGVQKKKEAQAKMQADAENQRRARLQDALSRLGSGVGSLGMA